MDPRVLLIWAPVVVTPGAAIAAINAWAPVIVALATMAGTAIAAGLAAYSKAQSNQTRLGALEQKVPKRSTDPGAISAPGAGATGSSSTGGGAGGAATISLPAWSQLRDPDPTGMLPAAASTDCGWECLSDIIRVTRGVEVEADYLRFLERGPGSSGVSNAGQLAAALRRHRFAPSAAETPGESLLGVLRARTGAKVPIICLGEFIQAGTLHWVAVAGVDSANVAYADPWYGTVRQLPHASFLAAYRGSTVDPGEPARYAP